MDHFEISTLEISPTILFAYRFPDDYGFTMENFPKLTGRRMYDYEIEIYLTDGGSILLEDKVYPLQRGSVIFRRPGQWAQTRGPLQCYCIVLDITGKTMKMSDSYVHRAPQPLQPQYRNAFLDNIQPLTEVNEPERLIYLFEQTRKEFRNNWPHTPLILRSNALEILYTLYADTMLKDYTSIDRPIYYHKAIRKAAEYINANYAKKITLMKIADYVGLSTNYLSRLFTDCMGITLSAYLMNVRLRRAKELLIYTQLHVWEVANLCGFESQAYFISAFKRKFQLTPRQLRIKYT